MKFYVVNIILVFLMQTFKIPHCYAAYQVGTGIADVTGPAAEIFMAITLYIFQLKKNIHINIFSSTMNKQKI